jgi:hypothetical protein
MRIISIYGRALSEAVVVTLCVPVLCVGLESRPLGCGLERLEANLALDALSCCILSLHSSQRLLCT